MLAVIESPARRHRPLVWMYLSLGIKVRVIEPFYAYHHDWRGRFSPPPLPGYIHDLVRRGKIKIIKASELGSRDMYYVAGDKSVSAVERTYPAFRKDHSRVIGYVSGILRGEAAEYGFKKGLCDRLAVFFSINTLIERLIAQLGGERVILHSNIEQREYRYLQTIAKAGGSCVCMHENVTLPVYDRIFCALPALWKNLRETMKIAARIPLALMAIFCTNGYERGRERKRYEYGVAVVNPARQLANNRRKPDFIVDENNIKRNAVVYLPLLQLNTGETRKLRLLGGDIYDTDSRKQERLANLGVWAKLFFLNLFSEIFSPAAITGEARRLVLEYLRWSGILRQMELRHFVTHCDFSENHIGRNAAFRERGIKTWYYTDSMNISFNYRVRGAGIEMRHPFWSYMFYDNFVTWDRALSEYYSAHPGSRMKCHVVGCLWADHIERKSRNNARFTVAAFDTTFTMNGTTSYEEGVAFAEHLLKLAQKHEHIEIVLKVKKGSSIHGRIDPGNGPRYVALLKEMEGRANMRFCSENEDSSEVISASDIVVSFPFTSTTFEALSAGRRAIWHDPLGCYKEMPYACFKGVVTHSYEELLKTVEEAMRPESSSHVVRIPRDTDYMDPYCDGNAIDRFRQLLVKAS